MLKGICMHIELAILFSGEISGMVIGISEVTINGTDISNSIKGLALMLLIIGIILSLFL
jgi:hypothetical protein